MAVWTTPKTDWRDGDYFNLTPDYERIKGNILYIQEFINKLYVDVGVEPMGEYDVTQYPLAAFLNVIADNVQTLSDAMFKILPTVAMPQHVGNGPGWTAKELNDIEENLLNMYDELNRQYAVAPKLSIMMGIGGVNFAD